MYPINMTPPFKATKADDPYWYLEFGNRIPCISFQNNFPDLRKRFYNANLIDKMAIDFVCISRFLISLYQTLM